MWLFVPVKRQNLKDHTQIENLLLCDVVFHLSSKMTSKLFYNKLSVVFEQKLQNSSYPTFFQQPEM